MTDNGPKVPTATKHPANGVFGKVGGGLAPKKPDATPADNISSVKPKKAK